MTSTDGKGTSDGNGIGRFIRLGAFRSSASGAASSLGANGEPSELAICVHENLQRQEKIKGSSDRSFGLVFATFFAFVAFAPMLRAPHQPRWWSIVVAALLSLAAIFWPKRLAAANRLWLKFGLLLHAVISPVLLALIFYVAIVPVGLLKGIFGDSPLQLRTNREASTYWVKRDSSGSAPHSMNRQF